MKQWTCGVLLVAMAATLGGCEPATGPQQPVKSVPDPAHVQTALGMEPAELALLLELAGGMPRQPVAPQPWMPGMGHPLDGLPPEQVRQLFAAAGVDPERYLPLPCGDCAEEGDAR
jgi:hypothetical protein